MRVCILGASSLRYMPYLKIYTSMLDHLGVAYEVAYWDRHGEDADRSGTHRYDEMARSSGIALIPQYLGFRRFVRGLPGIDRFDLFIVLGMQIGVFLADFLVGKRYVLDVRDFSHESNLVYRLIAVRVISGASMVAISSPGFLAWLPGASTPVVSHNLPADRHASIVASRLPSSRVISFIGGVRYLKPNKAIIRHMLRMCDWSLVFHGSGPDVEALSSFASENRVPNVSFTGPFRPEEKDHFYHVTDFVLCLYGRGSINERTLLPNRLYEACIYRRPIIVSAGTYLADVVARYGLGVVVNEDLSALQERLEAYFSQDVFSGFVAGCDRFLDDVRHEDQGFRNQFYRIAGATDGIR